MAKKQQFKFIDNGHEFVKGDWYLMRILEEGDAPFEIMMKCNSALTMEFSPIVAVNPESSDPLQSLSPKCADDTKRLVTWQVMAQVHQEDL